MARSCQAKEAYAADESPYRRRRWCLGTRPATRHQRARRGDSTADNFRSPRVCELDSNSREIQSFCSKKNNQPQEFREGFAANSCSTWKRRSPTTGDSPPRQDKNSYSRWSARTWLRREAGCNCIYRLEHSCEQLSLEVGTVASFSGRRRSW